MFLRNQRLSGPPAAFHRYIQSTCATSGEGLYEGLDWLSSNIASKRCGAEKCTTDALCFSVAFACPKWGHGSEYKAVYSSAFMFS